MKVMSEQRNGKIRNALDVLIINDVEGISGISHWHQIRYGYKEFEEFGRIQVTEDVNAAIRGLRAAGATSIKVVDSHGSGGPNKNIISEKLEKDVKLFQEKVIPERLKQAASKTIDAAVFIGFHAMADTEDGFLRHTITLEPRIRINGKPVGETALTAYALAEYGIPVIMATGDQALIREALSFLPGIETVQVKSSLDCRTTKCLPLSEAKKMIEIGAKRALLRINEFKPTQVRKPIKVDVSFPKKAHADLCNTIPRAQRRAEKTISFTAEDWQEANNFIRTTIRLAGQLSIGALLQGASRLEGAEKILHEWEENLVNEWLS
jgi:D-amino peptidase